MSVVLFFLVKKENEKREKNCVKTSRVERELTTLSKNHLLGNIAYFTEKCTAIEAVCGPVPFVDEWFKI